MATLLGDGLWWDTDWIWMAITHYRLCVTAAYDLLSRAMGGGNSRDKFIF